VNLKIPQHEKSYISDMREYFCTKFVYHFEFSVLEIRYKFDT